MIVVAEQVLKKSYSGPAFASAKPIIAVNFAQDRN